MRAAVKGITPLPDPRSTTTSSSRRRASVSIRSTLSSELGAKNENRSWDRVGITVKTANIVTSATRVNISVSHLTHQVPS